MMQYNNHLHKYKKTGFGGTSQHLGSRGRKSLIGDIVNSRPPGGLHKESLLQKVKRKEGRKERGKEERKEGKERKEKKDSNYIRNVCRLYANTIPFYVRSIQFLKGVAVLELAPPQILRNDCTCCGETS